MIDLEYYPGDRIITVDGENLLVRGIRAEANNLVYNCEDETGTMRFLQEVDIKGKA